MSHSYAFFVVVLVDLPSLICLGSLIVVLVTDYLVFSLSLVGNLHGSLGATFVWLIVGISLPKFAGFVLFK